MSDIDASRQNSPPEHPGSHEDRVRQRAYHLWEGAGRPHGQDAEFWERARELEAEETGPSSKPGSAVGGSVAMSARTEKTG